MTANEIIVGIDDSPSGRAALRWAAAYARSIGMALRAVHVVDRPEAHDMYAYPVVADYTYPESGGVEEAQRRPIMRVFDDVHPEPSWTLQFAQGHAGRIMVGESKDAKLLVLGAQEHRGLERLLVGSVGHYCLNHAFCPVVSVPAPEQHKDTTDQPIGPDASMAGELRENAEQARRRLIIVGVDDSAEAEAAARWAIREAELRKDDVLLAHAYEVPSLPPRGRATAIARGRQERQALLDKIAGTLTVPPTMHVEQLIEIDSPGYLLPRLSEQAELTVLGQDHLALSGHMPLGHVANTVASMSRHPVVAVPRGWTAQAVDRRPIAVAIDGRHPSSSTLGYAFTEASLHQAPMLVVHSAPLAELASGEPDIQLNLAEILASWKADYPDIDVETSLLAGAPRDTVAAVSADAQLLVVGVPYRGREWTRWIRSVARAVLVRSVCPVAVIPQQHPGLAIPD
jgi:nucleotide-binding universal stress UspA family protein